MFPDVLKTNFSQDGVALRAQERHLDQGMHIFVREKTTMKILLLTFALILGMASAFAQELPVITTLSVEQSQRELARLLNISLDKSNILPADGSLNVFYCLDTSEKRSFACRIHVFRGQDKTSLWFDVFLLAGKLSQQTFAEYPLFTADFGSRRFEQWQFNGHDYLAPEAPTAWRSLVVSQDQQTKKIKIYLNRKIEIDLSAEFPN